MEVLYNCDFIYCAKFLDDKEREYFIDDTLTDIYIKADNLKNLLFGLIHATNDYVQESYNNCSYRKNIRPVNEEEDFILPSELKIKGITIEQVIKLIEEKE